MNIAIIPARGGSKRIPRKNIKQFYGKPIIAWTIEAALKAGIFERVIVSTDDDEIAQIAKKFGAEVPFMRPKELSDDHTGTIEVVVHAIKWMQAQKLDIENICCMYATAPFIKAEDLIIGINALQDGNWAYTFAATSFGFPIFRSFKITEKEGVEMFFPEHFTTRSQDLPEAFHDAGQFYWGRLESWLEKKSFFDSHSKPILLPRWRVQDIDSQDDWHRAEMLASMILECTNGRVI